MTGRRGWGWARGSGALLGLLAILACTGCGAAALLVVSAAGGAVAASGEPQRYYNTQGANFDESRVAQLRTGIHTTHDVVEFLGHPQTKVFTPQGEEWSYRYYVPPSMLRSGMEKILTVRFRDGRLEDVRYAVSAL